MKLSLSAEAWSEQREIWPSSGRHILAYFDDETIVVYQAYKPSIGRFALEHQRFGGDFSMSRMTWIKPNFLWMMYRCDWGEARIKKWFLRFIFVAPRLIATCRARCTRRLFARCTATKRRGSKL